MTLPEEASLGDGPFHGGIVWVLLVLIILYEFITWLWSNMKRLCKFLFKFSDPCGEGIDSGRL
jgi:hypothetical protein